MFNADYCVKHHSLDTADKNVSIYLIIKRLTPLLKPYVKFLRKHNAVGDFIDIYKYEHTNYKLIKEF